MSTLEANFCHLLQQTNIVRANHQIFPTNELDIHSKRCRTRAQVRKHQPRKNQRWSIGIWLNRRIINDRSHWESMLFDLNPQTWEHRVSDKEAFLCTNIGFERKQSSPTINPPRDKLDSDAVFSLVPSDRCTLKGEILWQMRFRSTWCSALPPIDRKSSERNYNNLWFPPLFLLLLLSHFMWRKRDIEDA